MTGATLAFPAAASLADYPAPFVQDGESNFSIVVGSDAAVADVASAIDVAVTLGGQPTVEKTAQGTGSASWSATNGVTLNTENTDLYAEESFTKTGLKSTLTKEDLSILASGTVENVDGEDFNYDHYIEVGGKTPEIGNSNNDIDDDNLIVQIGTNTASPLYTSVVTFEQSINVTKAADDDATITLFGKDYTIDDSSDLTGDGLILYGGKDTATVSENSETTLTVDGTDFTLSVDSVTSDNNANVDIAGDFQDGVSEGDTFSVPGIEEEVRIDTIVYRGELEYGQRGKVIFSVGSEKLTLDHDSNVKYGSDDESIEGTKVLINGAGAPSDNMLSKIEVKTAAQDNDYDHLASGETFEDPVFGTFSFAFGGTSPDAMADSRSEISIEKDGDVGTLGFTHDTGNSVSLEWVYTGGGSESFGTNDYNYHLVEGQRLAEDDYFFVNSGDYTHVIKVDDIPSSLPSSGTKELKLEDVATGTTYTANIDTNGQDEIYIDGQKYFIDAATSGPTIADVAITWGSGAGYEDTGDKTTIFPYVEDENGAKITLLSQTDDVGVSDGDIIELPTGTLEINSDGGSVSGDADVSVDTSSGSGTTAVVVGSVEYHVDMDGGSTSLNFGIDSDQATGGDNGVLGEPAVLTVEESDDSDAENAMIFTVDVDTDNEVKVVTPDYTKLAGFTGGTPDRTGELDNGDQWYSTYYGTFLMHDYDDKEEITAYYPDNQVTLGAGFVEGGGSLSASGGGTVTYNEIMPVTSSVAKLDTDISQPSAVPEDLILVGGPCVNMHVSKLVKNGKLEGVDPNASTCAARWNEAPELQLVEDAFAEGQTALVVAGATREGTKTAAAKLQDIAGLPGEMYLDVTA